MADRVSTWTWRQRAFSVLFTLPVAVAFAFVEGREGCSWWLHLKFIALGIPAGLLGRWWGGQRRWYGSE